MRLGTGNRFWPLEQPQTVHSTSQALPRNPWTVHQRCMVLSLIIYYGSCRYCHKPRGSNASPSPNALSIRRP